MKTLYAIRDRIANALVGNAMYLIFAFRTDEEAIRYFSDCLLDSKSVLNKHPHDYELVALGELQDTKAGEVIQANGNHTVIITGTALLVETQRSQEQLELVKEA